MKRVLILSFSPIATDPRVMRQIQALRGTHALTVAGFGPAPEGGGLEFHDVAAPPVGPAAKLAKAAMLLAGFFEAYYWRIAAVRRTLAAMDGCRFDLVVANDVSALPVGLAVAKGAPLLLDAHEYTPREFEDRWRWRVFFQRYYTYLCRSYLPRTAAMTTVCEGIAMEYRRFGVQPGVLLNCPAPQDLPVRPVNPQRIRLIHHGIAATSRRMELTLELMQYLDERFTLDLMLMNSEPAYMRKLREHAARDSRIRFRDPVPMQEIAATIAEYDIGVFLLPPVNFNYHFALPNKFFEFVQARLAVAIGPSPEMARIVRQYGFGVVADNFDPRELARRLMALERADIEAMKRCSDAASRELNAEHVAEAFRGHVERLTA